MLRSTLSPTLLVLFSVLGWIAIIYTATFAPLAALILFVLLGATLSVMMGIGIFWWASVLVLQGMEKGIRKQDKLQEKEGASIILARGITIPAKR